MRTVILFFLIAAVKPHEVHRITHFDMGNSSSAEEKGGVRGQRASERANLVERDETAEREIPKFLTL